MKSLHFTIRALGFAGLALFMSSATCDLFGEADQITINATLEHEFQVHEEADQPGGALYSTEPEDEILDAADVNKDFAENADRIESITIKKVEYVLSGYSSTCPNDVGFSGGTLTFSDPDGTAGGTVVKNVSHASLKAAQGTVHDLAFSQAEADQIANLLKSKKKVKIDASGTLSCTPLFLTVKVKLDCAMKVKVFNP